MTDQPVLYRPRTGAVVAGVCAGIARRYRIDPIIIRVLMVALCFAGGFGVALYVAGIITIPRDTATPAPVRRLLPFTRRWPTLAVWLATAAAILVVLGAIGGWRGISAGLAPVVLIAIIGLAVTRRGAVSRPTYAPEPTPFERAADAWQERLDAHRQGLAVPATGDVLDPPASPPLPVPVAPARRGHGWAIALSLMAVGVGVLAILSAVGVTVPAAAYAAAVTVSLGVGLLASVRTGRPRGMTALAVLSCLVTAIAFSSTNGGFGVVHVGPVTTTEYAAPSVGQSAVTYTTVDAIPAAISSGLGDSTYDFSAVDVTKDVSTTISMSMGNLTIKVPAHENVTIDWRVKMGEAAWQLPNANPAQQNRSGLNLSDTIHSQADATSPTLHLVVDLGAGNLDIRT